MDEEMQWALRFDLLISNTSNPSVTLYAQEYPIAVAEISSSSTFLAATDRFLSLEQRRTTKSLANRSSEISYQPWRKIRKLDSCKSHFLPTSIDQPASEPLRISNLNAPCVHEMSSL